MRKRILATIAVFAMVVAMLPTIVMADGNSSKGVTLNVENGVIDIMANGYVQGDEATQDYLAYDYYADDPYGGGWPKEVSNNPSNTYILTGTSDGEDSYLDIMNFSGKEITYNITFKDLFVRSGEWYTAIRFRGNAAINLNITNIGDNKVYAGNHAAFKINPYSASDDDDWNTIYSSEFYNEDCIANGSKIKIRVNINNTFNSTLDLGTLWTEEYNYDTYGEMYFDYDGPKIFHNENKLVDMIFMINGREVVDNKAEVDDALSNYDNFDNTDSTCVHKTIIDNWSRSPLDVNKMTVEEFENNINGIECNLVCEECGDSIVVSPEKTRINDDGTGQYGAVFKFDNAAPVTLSIASDTNNDSSVWWSEPYGLVKAGSTNSSDVSLNDSNKGKTPDTGDNTNLILWVCLLAVSGAAMAVVVGRRRVNR